MTATEERAKSRAFTEPYFLNRPLSAGFDAFAAERDRSDESNFTQQSVGAGVRIGYELARRWWTVRNDIRAAGRDYDR